MNAPRIIPEAVRRVQIDASDPAVSAWVTANAGAGKTHVLAQRVIRLLLEGVDPAKILCITFTKAAAANMANRVFKTLREWTAFDDAALDAAIRKVADLAPDATRRARARRLFAVALETPGGLKVQTIHAFCTRVLHQFPFEANVAARFDVLDETSESQLLADISLGVFLDAAREPEGALRRALAVATAEVADRTFKEVVGEAIRKRDIVRKWLDHGGSMEAVGAGLCGTLCIAGEDTIEQVEQEMVEGPFLPSSAWAAAAATLQQGSKNDREQADRLLEALAATASERAENYIRVFLNSTSEPRQRLITKATEAAEPALAKRLDEERPRMLALIERRKAVACRDRTAALLTIADAVISRYQAAKERRGLLDYDDLIDKALVLLGEDRAAWVHYKLDQGIDHVLIDEAQDTSPKQWQIVRLLTNEFFAGAGARLVNRTIFAVGDEKQSIFSFQGAAPREFDGMRRAFATLCRGIEQELQYVQFRHSFRSGPNVLGAVDTVFARPEAFNGLSADNVKTVHEALPDATPGLVEVWDTVKPDPKREIEAWDAPFDDLTERSPQLQLANKIARNVKRWTGQGVGAGDVLVLVRQRGPLFEGIIRALKSHRIAVAGADRLVLTEHIAVMDLMVLADALLLPDDDLALATVLKSPLLGLDDDDLLQIAWQRKGSLRAALRAKAQTDKRFADADAALERFAASMRQPPFAFYARVLGAERGRQRFLARLGPEVDDALDEFLNLALDYERRETPSLQGFIAWLRAAQTNVKRDMEITRQEVRVMTVHGAKGLEAPIVILADTTTEPAGPVQRQPKLITLADDGAPPGGPDRFIWARAKATDVAVVAAARDRARGEAEDEHRRLLYVAMTRAIDRLIVCGAEGVRKPHQDCWWNLVSNALRPVSVEEPADDGDGIVLRYRKVSAPANQRGTAGDPDASASADAVPGWLGHDAPADPPPVQPLSPSRAHDEEVPVRASGAGNRTEREKAKTRGVLLHRLLQALPDIPREARAGAARRHLARNGKTFSPEEREAMIGEIGRVLDDPRFSDLFLPGSRAEVPLVGRYNGRPVSGVVDRLAVTADSVLIADYKTNRIAREDGRERPSGSPRLSAEVPQAYVTQLALYRAVLRQLYPDKTVRAALVWTDVPDLMELSAARLDNALTTVTSP